MRLLETRFCTIDVDPVSMVVRYTRSAVPYDAVADIEEEARRAAHALRGLPPGRRVLADLRAATPRNDPEFEAAIITLRREIFALHDRVAILVRTAAGMLQTRRHAREDGLNAEVFDDELAALAYVEVTSSGHDTAPPLSALRTVQRGPGAAASKSSRPPASRKRRPG